MSYVISIRRARGRDLAQAEVEHALAADGELRRADAALWTWHGLGIAYGNGELHTDGSRGWSSDKALAKLRAIATQLDASVIGEEGEDLTAATQAPPAAGRRLPAAWWRSLRCLSSWCWAY